MSLKTILRKVFPSIRARDAVLADIHKSTERLERRVSMLDMKMEYMFFCLQHLDGETDLDTKRRVFLNLPKASGRIADFQFAANYILSRVKKICDENGITFALCGGTALGAVRHRGFIPWDDDVDIDIMRDDYYRLQELLQNDEELVMMKYYKLRGGVEAGYLSRIKLKESSQFFIDVFPLDCMTIDPEHEMEAWKEKEALCEEFSRKVKEIFDRHQFTYRGREEALAVPEMDEEISALEREYMERYEQRFLPGGQYTFFTRGIGNGRWLRSIYRMQPYEEYLPFVPDAVIFEGNTYGAYKNLEALLKYQYGNIWELPSVIYQGHENEFAQYSAVDASVIERIRKDDTKDKNEGEKLQ